MRLLLDTHIMIWWALGEPRLSRRARELIEDEHNDVLVSTVSIWEIAVKNGLHRGDGIGVSSTGALALVMEAGFSTIPVLARHATAVESLAPHHGDPFDRMLVAQAQVETMRLVTHDARLGAYGEHVLLV